MGSVENTRMRGNGTFPLSLTVGGDGPKQKHAGENLEVQDFRFTSKRSSVRIIRWFGTLALVLVGFGAPAAGLSDFGTSLFSGAGNCAFCHDPWDADRAGKAEEAAVLATDWRATMMAHSFKDPLWRAVMGAEVKERPGLKSFIEDKCQTCHAPLARKQAHADGTNELAFADGVTSLLAGEGVGCTLCHQIRPGNLGLPESFTGHFQIATNREIFGPYRNVLTMPMLRHVNYAPQFGAHTQESGLCATCHTLYTPILDRAGKVVGEFPEQVPFLEWQLSDYPKTGRHCQDCHMPRLDEAVKVSARPPWLDPRAPFWKHQFVGGNAFMLGLLADNARRLEANADKLQFEPMIEQVREQIRRAARLHVNGQRNTDGLMLRVTVENLAGHKFPTGHPYRRAWLHVRVSDAKKRTLFESGDVDKQGRLRGASDGYAPHYDLISNSNQVQIYQSVMADAEGRTTWALLRGASYPKDNRLPPRGFSTVAEGHVAVRGGAETDSNFNHQASGRDEVTYRIALPEGKGNLAVEVELLYQPVPPEAVARLLESKEPEAQAFARLYRRYDKKPELVQAQRLRL